jgi:MoaA/NifB/PqqE/SkfB family radical SAM enzyme
LCRPLRARGIEVSILSTGLLFERYAAQIAEHVDSAIVSLDGPPELHDSIRHTPGGFALIERGVAKIRALRPDFPISARTVVQRRNHRELTATAGSAKQMGLNSISFLAADLTSTAFNRAEPWPLVRQHEIALGPEDLRALDTQLAALTVDPFVIDSPAHLARIADHFRAHLGLATFKAPRCNAPWVSALLTASGNVQPCFFHPSIGTLDNDSLMQILAASGFRDSLDVATNPTCQRCVCSLYLETNA